MLSAKTQYAVVALLRLATEHAHGGPINGRRLASEEGIPEGFLAQILGDLKRLGLVSSVRGASGGYRLSVAPESLTVGGVIEQLEPPPRGSCLASPTPLAAALAALCDEAQEAQRATLHGVTLAELADRAAPSAARMYYI